MPADLRIYTNCSEETQAVGRVLGENALPGDIFLLSGPLGAGKTCLTQGIGMGLGVAGHVRSPTFVLMTRYHGRLPLHHIDLYRLGGQEEVWDLGLEEQLFGEGVCVVEWAERALDLFPGESLSMSLDYGETDDQRTISFVQCPDRYRVMLEKISDSIAVTGEGPS